MKAKGYIKQVTDGSYVYNPVGIFTNNTETFGEVSPRNNDFNYPIAIAQKRAESRLILELAGLTESGWMSEDEIDNNVHQSNKAKQTKVKRSNAGDLANASTLSKLGNRKK